MGVHRRKRARSWWLAAIAALACAACQPSVQGEKTDAPVRGVPVIDAHFHGPSPGADRDQAIANRLAQMDANGIDISVLHIAAPEDFDSWLAAAPERFIAGPMLPCPQRTAEHLFCFESTNGWPDLDWLETELRSGRVKLLGELLLSYYPIAPDDPELAPYWALAAQYDVPVLVHTNSGPAKGSGPRRFEECCPNFDDRMGNPALLRPVLERHPDLRIVLQHLGYDTKQTRLERAYWEEALALMREYPNVYADMTITNSLSSEQGHREALLRLREAGLLDRIMFGSDNFDPGPSLARLDGFEFLTDAQRRGIMRDNAVRFFRLGAD